MYKVVAAAVFLFLAFSSNAMATCLVPITNKSPADAYQLMNNFNCLALLASPIISNPTFTGSVPTLSNGDGSVADSSTNGGLFTGQGSINDLTVQNKSGTSVCAVATGTTNWNCTGLQIAGVNVLAGASPTIATPTITSPCISGKSVFSGNVGNSKVSALQRRMGVQTAEK